MGDTLHLICLTHGLGHGAFSKMDVPLPRRMARRAGSVRILQVEADDTLKSMGGDGLRGASAASAETPPPKTIPQMAKRIAHELLLSKRAVLSGAYAIVGHGIGGWLAFELAMELARHVDTPATASGLTATLGLEHDDHGEPPFVPRAPLLLIVSGVRAPHLAHPSHDADCDLPVISPLPSPAFWYAAPTAHALPPYSPVPH